MIFWKRKIFNTLPWFFQKKLVKSIWIDPYQEFHYEHQAIFIHIPKTAGTSICYTLFDEEVSHSPVLNYKAQDEKKFKNYFKFTFIRNPWDRLVSAYSFLKQGGMDEADKIWANENLSEFDSFRSFVLALKKSNFKAKILKWNHFKPQYLFLLNENGKIEVDFIGRYENLNEDYEKIRMKLGKKNKLNFLNKSNRKDYTEYYDNELVEIVYNIYKKDINLFNYQFK